MTEPESASQGEGRPGGRKRALRLSTVLAVLGLGVAVVAMMAGADGSTAPPSDTAAASSAGTASVADPAPATATASRELAGLRSSAVVEPGGDQPIGPGGPATSGSMPENVNVPPEFQGLRDVLASQIDAYRAQAGDIEVAMAVTDLQTGQTISVNGNAAQRTACTINMFALFAVVGEFEAGRADPSDVAYNILVGIGGSYPPQVRQLLDAVFGDYRAGVARAREMMRSWGMQASLYDHVPYYGDETQNNLLTALETNTVLMKLYRGQLFSPEWTAYSLERLREIKWGLNYMLPGQLPEAATVAHKIGYYWDTDGWVNNDAGIVTFTGADGQEKAYAITYLSQKAWTEYAGYSFGARLSRIVWDWFEAKYVLGTAPPAAPPPPSAPPPPAWLPEPEPELPPEPTPTPESTATPTPEPTPSAAPSPTPASSPEATPIPTPG